MLTHRLALRNPLDELRRDMTRLLDGYGSSLGYLPGQRRAYPAMNVWEDEANFFVEAEVPGIKEDALEAYAVGNELTIKGRREAISGEKVSYQRQERVVGEFTRVITLPCDVDADNIDAQLSQGVLTIKLPKAVEMKPRRIAVKAG